MIMKSKNFTLFAARECGVITPVMKSKHINFDKFVFSLQGESILMLPHRQTMAIFIQLFTHTLQIICLH